MIVIKMELETLTILYNKYQKYKNLTLIVVYFRKLFDMYALFIANSVCC